jgi:hypothetical protein
MNYKKLCQKLILELKDTKEDKTYYEGCNEALEKSIKMRDDLYKICKDMLGTYCDYTKELSLYIDITSNDYY